MTTAHVFLLPSLSVVALVADQGCQSAVLSPSGVGPGLQEEVRPPEKREVALLHVSSRTLWKHNCEAAEPCSRDDCFY